MDKLVAKGSKTSLSKLVVSFPFTISFEKLASILKRVHIFSVFTSVQISDYITYPFSLL